MIVKVTALCVAVAMICSALRPIRPELATALSLAGGLAALALLLSQSDQAAEWVDAFRGMLRADRDISAIVLKGAGVAILSELGAQLCTDAGERALAGRIALAARVAMLGLCAPMVAELTGVITGTLG